MDSTLSAVFILAIMLVTVMLSASLIISSSETSSNTVQQASAAAGDRAKTSLSEDNPTTSTGKRLTVEVTNTGTISPSDYRRMDVIVEYKSNDTGDILYKRLRYLTTTGSSSVTDTITYDNANAGSEGGFADTTFSFSINVANNSNRILVVGTQGEDGTTSDCNAISVTYDSVPMTEIDEAVADPGGTVQCVSLWYLLAPNTGNNTVLITWNGTVSDRSGGAISLYNVAQQAPEDFNSGAVDSSPPTTISTGVTTLTDGAWLVDAVGSGNNGNFITQESGQQERYGNNNSGTHTGAGSTRLAATNGFYKMGWDESGANRLSHVVAAFAPSVTVTPGTAAVPNDNEWVDKRRTPDLYQPATWNRDEVLSARALLQPRQEAGTTGRVTIATPDGVSVTEEFTRPYWMSLASTPGTAHDGGALATDGTYIYALRGDSQPTFWRYDLDDEVDLVDNTWTQLASTTASVEEGGALVYAEDAGTPYIYALRGDDTTAFWQYDISADTWSTMDTTPASVRYGATLTWDGSDTIYAFRGGSGTSSAVCCDDFWSYDISGDNWSTGVADPSENVHEGASLAYVSGDIYATRGDNTIEFWRYNVSGDSWTALEPLPNTVMSFDQATDSASGSSGSTYTFSATVANRPNRILLVGVVGEDNSTSDCNATSVDFNSVGMIEITEVNADAGGGRGVCVSLWYLIAPDVGTYDVDITWNGTVSERMGGAAALYHAAQQAPEAFTTQSWLSHPTNVTTSITTLTDRAWVVDVIGTEDDGSNYVTLEVGQDERYDNDNSNSHRGAGSTKLAQVAGTSVMGWSNSNGNEQGHVVAAFAPISSEPAGMDEGGDLVWIGGDFLYAWRGDDSQELWRYSISGDNWVVMEDAPAPVGEGGDLVYLDGEIYGLRGDEQGDFWSYQPRGY